MTASELFEVKTERNYDSYVFDMRKETVKKFSAPILAFGSYTPESLTLIGAMIPYPLPADYSISDIYLFKGSGPERSPIPTAQKTMFMERLYPDKSENVESSRVIEVGPLDSDEKRL